MKNFDDLIKSPTFCSAPWVQLSTSSNGNAKICCLSTKKLQNEQGENFSFEKNRISEIWNSSEMQNIRKKMLTGDKLPECIACYNEEALGSFSMRIGFNEKWASLEKAAFLQRIEESKSNNYKMLSMPWYYDLRQGNLCNLKCRSCVPVNSSAIEQEYEEIAKTDLWFKNHVDSKKLDNSYRNWFLNADFNEQMLAEIPNIKMLYFTGGEPTLIEKNFTLLQHCIDIGQAKHIDLLFNTNLTKLTDRFVGIIKEFKHVMLNLSIDGYGAEQEYLRGNSKWAIIEANFEKLAILENKNFRFNLTPVIQACNVLTIDKLFYFIEKMNLKNNKNIFHFLPIILNNPKHLEVSILPKNVRILAAGRLQEYMQQSELIKADHKFKIRLFQIISKLNVESGPNLELLEIFTKSTQILDAHRGQSFDLAFPELFQSWCEESPDFKRTYFKEHK